MNTKEVAQMTGVSVRTLHHYDQAGLVSPGRNAYNGYREYDDEDIDRLQHVLFFRACGFSLRSIGHMLDHPAFDRAKAFALQRKALLNQRERIDAMLATLERSLQASKGEIIMSTEEKFVGFDFSSNPYEEEARRLWGDQAIDESNAKLGAMSNEEKGAVAKAMDALFGEIAALRHTPPHGEAAQQAVGRLFRHLNANFGTYSPQAFAGLGRMYVEDTRFTQNLEGYGEGLAAFLCQAMEHYADSRS